MLGRFFGYNVENKMFTWKIYEKGKKLEKGKKYFNEWNIKIEFDN